jgi:hypothetical protein
VGAVVHSRSNRIEEITELLAFLRSAAMPDRRVDRVANLLLKMWGTDMPSGATPYRVIAEDAMWIDDATGREVGIVVQGDGIRLADLRSLLRTAEPSAASERVRRALDVVPELISETRRRVARSSSSPARQV